MNDKGLLICFLLFAILLGILSAFNFKLPLIVFLLMFIFVLKHIFNASIEYLLIILVAIMIVFENNIFIIGGVGSNDIFVIIISLYVFKQNMSTNYFSNNKFVSILSILLLLILIIIFTNYFVYGEVEISRFIKNGLSISIMILIMNSLQNYKSRLKFYRILFYFALIASLIGLVQYFTNGVLLSGLITNYRYLGIFNYIGFYAENSNIQYIRYFTPGSNEFRAHGTYYSYNIFATFLSSSIFIGWLLIKNSKQKIFKCFYGIGSFIMFLALYVTFSRAGIYSLFVAIIIILLINSRSKLNKVMSIFIRFHLLLIGFIIIGTLIFIYGGAGNTSSRYLNFDFKNIKELSDRITLWELSYSESLNNFFVGSGVDFLDPQKTNFLIFNKVSSHNTILHLLYSWGFLYTLIIFVLSIYALFRLLKEIFKGSESLINNESLIIFVTFVSFIISGITESLFINYSMSITFWVFLGLSFVVNKNYEGKEVYV